MASDRSWQKIWDDKKLDEHNFTQEPVIITANEIKRSCQDFTETNEKEVRILCKQDLVKTGHKFSKTMGFSCFPRKMVLIT